MNILVLDVAASESGALTVLNDFYKKFSANKENRYFICVSVVDLKDTDNIKVLKFQWVKKSWLHRLWFDYVVAPKLIKQHKIDEIFSLQNTLIPAENTQKTLYVHQPLPFVTYRYSLFEEPKFWVYQNIISCFIKSSAKMADRIIVQTKWMKDAIVTQCKVDEQQIVIDPPKYETNPKNLFDMQKWNNSFIYPATNLSYKNHMVIFKATRRLKEQGVTNFKVYLTLTEEEIPEKCKKIYQNIKEQIVCMGKIPHEKLMEMYAENILLFPSYIETFGLPLLEARMCNSPVIAADTEFAREILAGYDKAKFFDYDDFNMLSKTMIEVEW